jgi:hypothetical protein
MGWVPDFVKDIGSAAASAVGKVAEVATGGKIGDWIASSLERFGLPKEICQIMACIGDPSYTAKQLADKIDEVGQKLGLPKELTGALKKMIDNAEKYAMAFAKGGFGAVICEVGKDLGVPPELYLAVAAAVDAYTGNAAGAAANLMQLAGKIAKHLGVPDNVVNIVEFAGAAYSGDVKGMLQEGMQVLDGMDVLPPELETFGHLAVAAATGDDAAVQENFFKFADQIGTHLGLPPEVMSGIRLAAAYQSGDQKQLEAAIKDFGGDLVRRLPAEVQGPLMAAVDQFAKDPKGAWEAIKDLPDQAKEAFKTLTAAAKNPELLKKAADLGIDQLPDSIKGPVRDAVDAYLKDPKSAMELIKALPGQAKDEFFKLLDKATDPEYLKSVAKEQIDKQIGKLTPDARKSYELVLHLATGNLESVKEDLKKFSKEEIAKLPPAAQEALKNLEKIANGDTESLKAEFNNAKKQAITELSKHYNMPLRG